MKPSKKLVKLNLGSGKTKKEGFLSVDCIKFNEVDVETDLRERWPWKDESVEEAFSSHFIEHLDSQERVHFANELYRVLIPGGKCQIIAPHWSSCRAYGDPTHKWPPVSEFWLFYLNQKWRDENCPHADFKHWKQGFYCDFDVTWGYVLEPGVAQRNQEYQQHAMTYFKEACQDMIATLVKKS